MVTTRDIAIIGWLARMRFATADQVARKFEVHARVSYRRLAELVRQGLVWHERGLLSRPGVYGPTDAGADLAHADVGGSRWNWRDYEHTLALVDLYTELEKRYELTTERQLLAELYADGLPAGRRPHLPDGALLLDDGRTVAIELERTSKSQARLRQILTWYARDRRYAEVWYFCPRGAMERLRATARGADWLVLHPWPSETQTAEHESV